MNILLGLLIAGVGLYLAVVVAVGFFLLAHACFGKQRQSAGREQAGSQSE